MGFFSNIKADRIITELRANADAASPGTRKAIARLRDLGESAIQPLIAALPDASKEASAAFLEALALIVSAKTFPLFIKAMSEGGPRVVAGIKWALTVSRAYPPTLLLEALGQPDVPKAAILEAIVGQRDRFTVRDLLTAAFSQQANEKAALFRVVSEIATPEALPELMGRLQGKDQIARLHIINMLGKFNIPEVRIALQDQLKDPNKLIRSASLSALGKMDGLIDVSQVVPLLRDPEIDVQSKAIDVITRANDPQTISLLVEVMKDPEESARRAAVEVLNEICDANSVKYLLEAIADADWWVRSRAADALGRIGGPKVVKAVLALVKDDNEDIRRAAIEILNQTRDESAVDQLIDATRDKDWWVSERAVDALAEIGNRKAVPRLTQMLQRGHHQTLPVVMRAIGKLGDGLCIDPILAAMKAHPEKELQVEALYALARLSDEARAPQIQEHIESSSRRTSDPTVAKAAAGALAELRQRLATGLTGAGDHGTGALQATAETGRHPAATRSPPLSRDAEESLGKLRGAEAGAPERRRSAAAAAAPPRLDISTLNPGDLIEGRYKFIEKIGKGAFGTVLLMEDTVVDDRLILKFLNPNVAEDEETMKRFVHELRYSRKITHRNVIRIYDFLYIQGNYAISMEYFPSHTLGQEIVDDKPLDLSRAIGFAIDICTGMDIAHQAGVVHRDLKPANVLINNDGLLKIVDFGVAAVQREGDTHLTKTGYVIGSPKYMAPEQILGKKIDQRADVYATGVILYEMLTGTPPYTRGDHMAVMYQHVQGKARRPVELNPSLPKALSDVVMRAMTVDKSLRYQTMDELRIALTAFR